MSVSVTSLGNNGFSEEEEARQKRECVQTASNNCNITMIRTFPNRCASRGDVARLSVTATMRTCDAVQMCLAGRSRAPTRRWSSRSATFCTPPCSSRSSTTSIASSTTYVGWHGLRPVCTAVSQPRAPWAPQQKLEHARDGIAADDFAIRVSHLPKDATKQEIIDHFNKYVSAGLVRWWGMRPDEHAHGAVPVVAPSLYDLSRRDWTFKGYCCGCCCRKTARRVIADRNKELRKVKAAEQDERDAVRAGCVCVATRCVPCRCTVSRASALGCATASCAAQPREPPHELRPG